MNTHMRGPAATGQAAIISQRGFPVQYNTAAGTTALLTVAKQDTVTPCRVDIDIIVEQAFNGTGVSLTVQRIKPDGTTSTVVTSTFAAGDNIKKSVLSYGADQFNVVFAPGTTATTGQAAVYARAAGNGQLVG